MLSNKKFRGSGLTVIIICFIGMYFFSAISNDGTNILTTSLALSYGWDPVQITNPLTWGGLALIVLTPVFSAIMIKKGCKQSLLIGLIITAAALLAMACSNGNYTMYAVSAFIVRVFCVFLQLAGFMLCAEWFIRYRGRALGIVTGGGPICSATFIAIMMSLVMNPEIGFQKAYTGLAVLLFIFAIVAFFALKNKPEDIGCYPDGGEKPSDEDKDEFISLKEVAKKKESWIVVIVFGILQFIVYAMMAFYVTNMTLCGLDPAKDNYMLWLTVGCILGFPMSFILGLIDDKLGSVKATYVLIVLNLFALLPMAFMSPGKPLLLVLAAFGIGSITGGMTTMFPSITGYVFGRKVFMAAQKWLMAGTSIFIAFTPAYMSHFAMTGSLKPAYLILVGGLVVAALVMIPLIKVVDANISERDYGKKAV